MATQLTLVLNPVAGRGRAIRHVDAVLAALRSEGNRVDLIREDTPAATSEAVKRAVASGVGGVVALGGDGLLQLVAQELAGTDTPLGIVPGGTGNDLALALGIPTDPVGAAGQIGAGEPAAIDAVRTGERWWLSVLCAGFDSAVSERVNRMRWPRGPRRFEVALAAELARLRTDPLRIEVDGVPWEGPATLVAVGNTSQYGGGYRMCPLADPADGLLDVTVVGRVGRIDLARMLPSVRAGRHLRHRAVTTLRGREVTIRADGVVGYADGERLGPLPITSRCVPGALRVWLPRRA